MLKLFKSFTVNPGKRTEGQHHIQRGEVKCSIHSRIIKGFSEIAPELIYMVPPELMYAAWIK